MKKSILIIFVAFMNLTMQATDAKRPHVGVGVFIVDNGKILLGLRKNSHGQGSWGLPGGHLEYGESFDACAQREVLEEVGMEVFSLQFYGLTNDIFHEEDKHYVTIFLMTDQFIGIPQLLEPDYCEQWAWFDYNNLPEHLFLPLKNIIANQALTL